MKFRPCIDIHDGKVKQIVGGSLSDTKQTTIENFVSKQDAAYYARLYKKQKLKGGHIILLNAPNSDAYQKDIEQARKALKEYPFGLQIGGGIHDKNAKEFLEMGASHVIVTSFVFQNGKIQYDKLNKLVKAVGKKHLVLDLSCRKRGEQYYIVTNRWQTFTNVCLSEKILEQLSSYCDEFLIHAVDVEGKANGIEKGVISLLGDWIDFPITYAGGISSFEDLEQLKQYGKNKLDVTIGSALDLFGGPMSYIKVLQMC